MLRLEGVGDVLEEDQAEDDVLVLGRVHVVAQRVGGGPELGLEAEVGGGVVALGHTFCHEPPYRVMRRTMNRANASLRFYCPVCSISRNTFLLR